MARSRRVRATDELAIVRLVGECRDLGADARAWQAHLVAGLQHLTGGLVAGAGAIASPLMNDETVGEYVAGVIDGGWPSVEARERFLTWLTEPPSVASHPAFVPFSAAPEAIASRTRRELVADGTWDRSGFVNEELRPRGFDEGMLGRCPTAIGSVYILTAMREAGERPFGLRTGRVVQRLLEELAPHLGRSLWLTAQPHVGGLTPRRRQVLGCLLDGDGEKQVARRLGLHPATVHDHVKSIYLHFGVSSRPELLAAFLRRNLTPRP